MSATNTTIITSQMLWNELQEVKDLLRKVVTRDAENNIEEISLYKASKLMHMNQNKIIKLVEENRLSARVQKTKVKDPETGEIKIVERYRFRICDIHRYQNSELYDPEEDNNDEYQGTDTEDLIEKHFGYKPRRKAKG